MAVIGARPPVPRLGAAAALEGDGRLLVVRWSTPHDTLSWAPVNGGRRPARAVAWREVAEHELGAGVEPEAFLRAILDGAGLGDAVGLLTARRVASFDEVAGDDGGYAARAVATVGLGNALACGDPPGPLRRVGTINLLCQVSHSLDEGALVEACALAAEARTAAVLAAAVPSRRSGRPATGTGTDCIVVAAPLATDAPRERYVGKHTALGALIGWSVHAAVARGVERWLAEQDGAVRC